MDQPTSNKKLAPISQATSQIPSSQETLTLILNLVFALSLFSFYKYKVKIQIRYNEDPLLLFHFFITLQALTIFYQIKCKYQLFALKVLVSEKGKNKAKKYKHWR